MASPPLPDLVPLLTLAGLSCTEEELIQALAELEAHKIVNSLPRACRAP